MWFITFILGFLCAFILFEVLKNFVIIETFRRMEIQLLFAALSLIQYKYHAIKIVELAYDEASEKYPAKADECKLVVAKIHEKFDGFGDGWVQDLIQKLPYKADYNDWKTAIVYAERLINDSKKKQ